MGIGNPNSACQVLSSLSHDCSPNSQFLRALSVSFLFVLLLKKNHNSSQSCKKSIDPKLIFGYIIESDYILKKCMN